MQLTIIYEKCCYQCNFSQEKSNRRLRGKSKDSKKSVRHINTLLQFVLKHSVNYLKNLKSRNINHN